MASYVFYDTETTGTLTSFDQILQFGAIRTDDELNELDRYEIRCRLLPHVVPSPGAMRATRVTPTMLTDTSLPTHYEAMRQVHETLAEWSPAVFIGYNSIAFDENLLRQAFYQTLQPVYLTNTSGNARADMMRILHATSVYAPNTLSVPISDSGRPTFRLDRIAPANGFAHEDAHEAMADVEATIHMARLVRDRAPDVWRSMMRVARKKDAIDLLKGHPVVANSAVYRGQAHSWPVTYCGSNPNYDAELAAFDLSNPPEDYLELSVEELVNVLNRRPPVIRTVRANAQPILIAADQVPPGTIDLELDIDELERRAWLIRENGPFRERVGQALMGRLPDKPPSPHVELQIFDGFPSWADERIMAEFHDADWQDRPTHMDQLSDPRMREVANRLVYFERPDFLPKRQRLELDSWLADRLLSDSPDVPWRTLPKAIQEADDLLENAAGDEAEFLKEVRSFLDQPGEAFSPN